MHGTFTIAAIALLLVAAPALAQQASNATSRPTSAESAPAGTTAEHSSSSASAPATDGLAAELSRLQAQERDRVAGLAAQLPTSTPEQRLALQRRIEGLKAAGTRDRLALQLADARDHGDAPRAARLQEALDHARKRVDDLARAASAAPAHTTTDGGEQ